MSEVPKSSTANTLSEGKDLPEGSHNDITKLYIPIIKRFEIPKQINKNELWDQVVDSEDNMPDKQKIPQPKISVKK